jgi:hypothetical protein
MNLKELQDRVTVAEPNGMLKVNINHGDGNEGIWACFATPQDKEVYDKNKVGDPFEVFLLNQALIGGPSWGARLKLKAGGDNRPMIAAAKVIEQIIEAVKSGDYPTAEEFAKTTPA